MSNSRGIAGYDNAGITLLNFNYWTAVSRQQERGLFLRPKGVIIV